MIILILGYAPVNVMPAPPPNCRDMWQWGPGLKIGCPKKAKSSTTRGTISVENTHTDTCTHPESIKSPALSFGMKLEKRPVPLGYQDAANFHQPRGIPILANISREKREVYLKGTIGAPWPWSRRGCPLGESGGMLPRKILKIQVPNGAIPAFKPFFQPFSQVMFVLLFTCFMCESTLHQIIISKSHVFYYVTRSTWVKLCKLEYSQCSILQCSTKDTSIWFYIVHWFRPGMVCCFLGLLQ